MAQGPSIEGRIGVQGLDELKAKLAEFGAIGEKAFDQIKQAVDKQPLAQASKDLEALKTSVAGFVTSTNNLINVLSGGVGGVVTSLTARFGPLGLAATAIGGTLTALAKGFSSTVLEIKRAAEGFGLSTEDYQVFSKAAKDAGLSQDDLNSALGRFAGTAAKEAREQFGALAALGKEVATSFGKTTNSAFAQLQLPQIREKIAPVVEQLKALFRQTGDKQLGQLANLPDFAFTDRIAKLSQSSGKVRELIEKLGVTLPANNPLQAIDESVRQVDGGFAALGVRLVDNQGKLRSNGQTLAELIQKIKGLGDTQSKLNALEPIFGRSDAPKMLRLIEDSGGKLGEIRQKLGAGGKLISDEDIAKAEQLERSFKSLETSAGNLQKTLGRLSIGPLNSAIEKLNALFEAFEKGKELLGKTSPGSPPPLTPDQPPPTERHNRFRARPEIGDVKQNLNKPGEFFNDVKTKLQEVGQKYSEATEPARTAATAIKNVFTDMWSTLTSDAKKSVEDIKNAAQQVLGGGSSGSESSAEGHASGGHITGPGTGTSDSILARVSNGEYVVRADAVRRVGVGFLDAINARGFAGGGEIETGKVDTDPGYIPGDPFMKDLTRKWQRSAEIRQKLQDVIARLAAGGQSSSQIDALEKEERVLEAGDPQGRYVKLSSFARGGLVEAFHGFSDRLNALNGHVSTTVSMPHFADGGFADKLGSGSTVNVDLRTDHGKFSVQASENTVKALGRAAMMRRLSSTGPRPSWFG